MPAKKKVVSVPRYESFTPRSGQTSRVGAGNRRQDTTPEILLRAALRAARVKYRSHAKGLPGCPDFVLAAHKIVVFCDGDFWHGRNWSQRKRMLQSGWNADYWIAKIERNRQRDRAVTRALRTLGWRVVRIWEGDIRRDPHAVVARISKAVAALRDVVGPTARPGRRS